jgi:hypothetical protein
VTFHLNSGRFEHFDFDRYWLVSATTDIANHRRDAPVDPISLGLVAITREGDRLSKSLAEDRGFGHSGAMTSGEFKAFSL